MILLELSKKKLNNVQNYLDEANGDRKNNNVKNDGLA